MNVMDATQADSIDTSRIPTNLRMLLIMEIVAKAPRALTPTEINRELGLPKQSIHRLCATLVQEGFLSYEPNGRTLRPARRARSIASGILYSSRIHIARHQLLEEVASITGETVNFVVPEEAGMSYVDRVETDWAFRVQLPVGSHVPFHATASGKTFLASLEPNTRQRMVASLQLEKLTDNTVTDASGLIKELQDIASDGFAIDREEFMEGMVAIAVPIRDSHGRYIAAIAVHGPTIRLSEEVLLSHQPLLADAAQRLSETMTDG